MPLPEWTAGNFSNLKTGSGVPIVIYDPATVRQDPNDPTKTIPAPYNASNSGGSNLGPSNKALIDRVKGDMDKLKAENPSMQVPADLVTTIRELVEDHTEGRLFGLLGEPRVNVLKLNLALDQMAG